MKLKPFAMALLLTLSTVQSFSVAGSLPRFRQFVEGRPEVAEFLTSIQGRTKLEIETEFNKSIEKVYREKMKTADYEIRQFEALAAWSRIVVGGLEKPEAEQLVIKKAVERFFLISLEIENHPLEKLKPSLQSQNFDIIHFEKALSLALASSKKVQLSFLDLLIDLEYRFNDYESMNLYFGFVFDELLNARDAHTYKDPRAIQFKDSPELLKFMNETWAKPSY